MGKAAERIAAKVAKLTTGGGDTSSSAESATASEASVTAPPARGASEAVSGSAAGGSMPASAALTANADGDDGGGAGSDAEVRAARLSLLAEKTRALRESRHAKKAEARLSEREKELEEKRRATEEERKRWTDLQPGDIKSRILAAGGDPKAVFDAMQKEALEAGKPEAEIRRMRAEFEKNFDEKLKPLADTIAELKKENEDLKADRQRDAEDRARGEFAADYRETAQQSDYADLRIEYGDQRLFRLCENMKKNPDELRAFAKQLNVKLTFPDKRFNMKDILTVLKAAHVQHETEKKQRRDQMQAPTTSPGAPQQAPANARTVNGTADKRNAGTNPLGNDNAASKASAPGNRPRMSRQSRIDRAMARDAARRG